MEIPDLVVAFFIFVLVCALVRIGLWALFFYSVYRQVKNFESMSRDQQLERLIQLNNQGNTRELTTYINKMPMPVRDEVAHIAASNGIDPSFLYRL
jgi:hypothetical protein